MYRFRKINSQTFDLNQSFSTSNKNLTSAELYYANYVNTLLYKMFVSAN